VRPGFHSATFGWRRVDERVPGSRAPAARSARSDGNAAVTRNDLSCGRLSRRSFIVYPRAG